MLLTIGLVLTIAGVGCTGVVVVRAMPRMRLLPMRRRRSRRDRETAVKERIMLDRITRRMHGVGALLRRRSRAMFGAVGPALDRGYRRLRLLAQEHRPLRAMDAVTCDVLVADAAAALDRQDFDDAEERYLACLKADTKHRGAYLGLAALYAARKELVLAEETLRFLRKLYPSDSDIMMKFAEILVAREKPPAALKEMQGALRIAPKNPRYLDFAVELAIVKRDRRLAEQFLEQLRDANPENAKLEELEGRVREL